MRPKNVGMQFIGYTVSTFLNKLLDSLSPQRARAAMVIRWRGDRLGKCCFIASFWQPQQGGGVMGDGDEEVQGWGPELEPQPISGVVAASGPLPHPFFLFFSLRCGRRPEPQPTPGWEGDLDDMTKWVLSGVHNYYLSSEEANLFVDPDFIKNHMLLIWTMYKACDLCQWVLGPLTLYSCIGQSSKGTGYYNIEC